MKKFILSLTLMVASLAAWAETGFYVVDYQGNRVGYAFLSEPSWTFQGDNLVITTVEGSVEYPMDGVAQIVFDDIVPTGLNELNGDEFIRFVNGGVELAGFAANTVITVYNLQGQQMATYRTGDAGSLNLSLDGLDQGIYIIKANKSTIKIKK